MKLIIRILANSAAILTASKLVPGFVFSGTYLDLLIAGIVLGAINALVRPVLKIISFPLILITLGFFSVIINMLMLYLAASFLPTLEIYGVMAAFWGLVIISLVNNLINYLSKENKH